MENEIETATELAKMNARDHWYKANNAINEMMILLLARHGEFSNSLRFASLLRI